MQKIDLDRLWEMLSFAVHEASVIRWYDTYLVFSVHFVALQSLKRGFRMIALKV